MNGPIWLKKEAIHHHLKGVYVTERLGRQLIQLHKSLHLGRMRKMQNANLKWQFT